MRARIPFAALCCLLAAPSLALAGGTEFPANGTRGLGRGGANLARADDPFVMVTNPALLADLWDDQAMLGAHLLIADSCFQPTGYYGWGATDNDVAVFGEDEQPLFLQAEDGDTTLDGVPLVGYEKEAYPEVCYQGPAPILPFVGLAMKLDDDLGIGVGFFPPEIASLRQFGNADGTVDTPNGLRPSPLRFAGSHLNASYFSALGAIGYRPADWIRVGFGFQWSLVVFVSRTWTIPQANLEPRKDIVSDAFGRDLFIPGVIGSVHMVPFDALDIMLGAKWQDRVSSKAKLDITTGVFGTGDVFEFYDASRGPRELGMSSPNEPLQGTVPFVNHNIEGEVDAPPIWAPQLSLGIRFADRLQPRARDWAVAHDVSRGKVEDSMATERWDIELDFIYYLNSTYDKTTFTNRAAERLALRSVQAPQGTLINNEITAYVGDCIEPLNPETRLCDGARAVPNRHEGQDQWTVRLGGDYNVLPGIFTVRAGASYETSGQDVEFFNPRLYMGERIGLHGGLTWRIADKTDLSFGFAHFIHPDIRLQVNDAQAEARYSPLYKTPEYNFAPGEGVDPADPTQVPGATQAPGDFDGVAKLEVPYGGLREEDGPFFLNAGSFFYDLDVVSISLTQHF
jgi:hypothetical protein